MTHPQHRRTGLSRILHATGYSWKGLRAAFQHESAFRQELLLTAALAPLAFWIGRQWHETALLLSSLVLVLVVELLNTAVEAVVDRIGPEIHELAGRAKDVGSAAVLLTLLGTAALWLTALWQRISST